MKAKSLARRPSGGLRMKRTEPSRYGVERTVSSAPKATKITGRGSGCSRALSAAATASIPVTPEALSLAP